MRGYKSFDGTPHPGDLRHRVQIGYTENTINENGYPEPKDVILCKVWASAIDAGNQHYRAADVMNTEQVVNFTIRYRSDVKPGMWVLFSGEKWEISTLGEYAFTKAYLLAAAAEDGEETVEGTVKAVQGWVDCFERCELAGTIFAGGVNDVGDIAGHPALEKAYQAGKEV